MNELRLKKSEIKKIENKENFDVYEFHVERPLYFPKKYKTDLILDKKRIGLIIINECNPDENSSSGKFTLINKY